MGASNWQESKPENATKNRIAPFSGARLSEARMRATLPPPDPTVPVYFVDAGLRKVAPYSCVVEHSRKTTQTEQQIAAIPSPPLRKSAGKVAVSSMCKQPSDSHSAPCSICILFLSTATARSSGSSSIVWIDFSYSQHRYCRDRSREYYEWAIQTGKSVAYFDLTPTPTDSARPQGRCCSTTRGRMPMLSCRTETFSPTSSIGNSRSFSS